MENCLPGCEKWKASWGPTTVLRSMRGSIVDARIAYPDVLHVEVRDTNGELWRLTTQDADWSPSDPTQLAGRSIVDAEIEETSGELRCKLSDGSALGCQGRRTRGRRRSAHWELIGPAASWSSSGRDSWQISSADAPTSSRRRVSNDPHMRASRSDLDRVPNEDSAPRRSRFFNPVSSPVPRASESGWRIGTLNKGAKGPGHGGREAAGRLRFVVN
jgi:hypothetical protein